MVICNNDYTATQGEKETGFCVSENVHDLILVCRKQTLKCLSAESNFLCYILVPFIYKQKSEYLLLHFQSVGILLMHVRTVQCILSVKSCLRLPTCHFKHVHIPAECLF
jgi:hypothetical protein